MPKMDRRMTAWLLDIDAYDLYPFHVHWHTLADFQPHSAPPLPERYWWSSVRIIPTPTGVV